MEIDFTNNLHCDGAGHVYPLWDLVHQIPTCLPNYSGNLKKVFFHRDAIFF